jgi:hypothetical protein
MTDYRITYSMRESVTTSADYERLSNQAKSKLKLGTPENTQWLMTYVLEYQMKVPVFLQCDITSAKKKRNNPRQI